MFCQQKTETNIRHMEIGEFRVPFYKIEDRSKTWFLEKHSKGRRHLI